MIAGPAPGRSGVADDRGARGGEDAGADRGTHTEGGEVPATQRSFQPAAVPEISLEVGDGLPRERSRLAQRGAPPGSGVSTRSFSDSMRMP